LPLRRDMLKDCGVVMLMREFYPLTGGYQSQALRLAKEMLRRGIGVRVLTQDHGRLARHEVYDGLPIHRVSTLPRGHLAAWSYLVQAFWWMLRNRRSFDLIHANRSTSGLVGGLIGRALGKRVLCKLTREDEIDVKGYGAHLLGRLKLACLKRTVHRFVAITGEIEGALTRLGVPAARVVRIANGIGLDELVSQYDRAALGSDLGWGPDMRVVTFVGRLVPAKGLDWLLDVWAEVVRREPRGRLLIVGDGPERRALEANMRALGIEHAVTFVGHQEDVYRFLAVTDVFVLPSRKEGVSNALLEAMSQGLPVIAADDELGGNREVVRDGVDGYLVGLGDSVRFAEALLRLLSDPKLRRDVGRRARCRIEQEFSLQRITDRYLELYEELLNGWNRHGGKATP